MSNRCEECGAKPAFLHERTRRHLCGGHKWRADIEWRRALNEWRDETAHELPSWMLPAVALAGAVWVLCAWLI